MSQDQKNQEKAGNVDAAQEVMQRESPRKCKICGGPNHQGCGCETKALQEAEEDSNRFSSDEQQPPPITEIVGPQPDQPGQEPSQEEIDRVLKHIKVPDIEDFKLAQRFNENFENIVVSAQDIISLLKTISVDVMAIKAATEFRQDESKPPKRTVRLKSKKRKRKRK